MRIVDDVELTGELQGRLLKPKANADLGVVVLAGSSGRVDVARAELFATRGALALALRWFGGTGQIPGICEIPLEYFTAATETLIKEGCNRIAYVGTSKGAEAALLVAIDDPRIDAVVALSPSSVVWANTGAGRDGAAWPQRSSWTRGGVPLPFMRYDETAWPAPSEGLVSYRGLHERSLLTFAADLEAATIPVEKARADILLVAGEDDALWPSDKFANAIVDRRIAFGKTAILISHSKAGHRALLPGETTPRSKLHAHGGSDEADRELGERAWHAMLTLFRLPS